MLTEVSTAVEFIASHLYNKLPRRRVDLLANELDRAIRDKCQGHWFPDQPLKSAAYRCLRVTGDHPDPAIFQACRQSGMDIGEVFSCLPDQLTLWIDPGQVSHKIGDKGIVRVLYSDSGIDGSTNDNNAPEQLTDFDQLYGNTNTIQPPFLSQSVNTSPEVTMTPPDFALAASSSSGMFPPMPYNICDPENSESIWSKLANQSSSSGAPNDSLSASYSHMTLSPSMATGPHPALSWSASASPTAYNPTSTNMAANFYNYSNGPPSFPSNNAMATAYCNFLQKSTSTPNFTAASFAQTKFGSTKIKGHGGNGKQMRPTSRLSPSEILSHQSLVNGQPPVVFPPQFGNTQNFNVNRPQAVSPTTTLPPLNNNSQSFLARSISVSPSMPQAPSFGNKNNFYSPQISTNMSNYDNPFILSPPNNNNEMNHQERAFELPDNLADFDCNHMQKIDDSILEHHSISSDLLSEIGVNSNHQRHPAESPTGSSEECAEKGREGQSKMRKATDDSLVTDNYSQAHMLMAN